MGAGGIEGIFRIGGNFVGSFSNTSRPCFYIAIQNLGKTLKCFLKDVEALFREWGLGRMG